MIQPSGVPKIPIFSLSPFFSLWMVLFFYLRKAFIPLYSGAETSKTLPAPDPSRPGTTDYSVKSAAAPASILLLRQTASPPLTHRPSRLDNTGSRKEKAGKSKLDKKKSAEGLLVSLPFPQGSQLFNHHFFNLFGRRRRSQRPGYKNKITVGQGKAFFRRNLTKSLADNTAGTVTLYRASNFLGSCDTDPGPSGAVMNLVRNQQRMRLELPLIIRAFKFLIQFDRRQLQKQKPSCA